MSDMILEMSDFPVHQLRFANRFEYQSGTLEVDRAALIQLVLEDQRIETAEFEAPSGYQKAELEVARKLAAVRVGITHASMVSYDVGAQGTKLPRVVLIQGCITQPGQSHSGVSYYRMPIRESLATAMHPNE